MYLVLSTYDHAGGRNVGDKLLTDSAVRLIRHVKGNVGIRTVFRGSSPDVLREMVPECRGIVLPGFAVRQDLIERVYPALEHLLADSIPIVPLGAGTKVHPIDLTRGRMPGVSRPSLKVLVRLGEARGGLACRDIVSAAHLRALGVANPRVVGDCAWYRPEFFNVGFAQPRSLDKVAFTPPHDLAYYGQAETVLKLLSDMFRNTRRVFVHQSRKGEGERQLEAEARANGFEVVEGAGLEDLAGDYREYDLHVGYRLHAHLAFLQQRRPSIVLHEDSRAFGATASLGHGGLNAFESRVADGRFLSRVENARVVGGVRSKVRLRRWRKFAARDVGERLKAVLEYECGTSFESYRVVQKAIDETYQRSMLPVLKSLPDTRDPVG